MRHSERVLFAITIAGFALLPWVLPEWPSQDGPNHLAVAHILEHSRDAGSPFAAYFIADRHALIPSTLVYQILRALAPIAGAVDTEKVLVSIAVTLLPLSVLSVVRTIDRTRMSSVFLMLPLVTGWALAMGFLSYVLAVGAGYFVIALFAACRDAAPGIRRSGLAAGASAALFVCGWLHPAVAVLTGLALALFEGPRIARAHSIGLLAAIGAPTILFLGASLAHPDAVPLLRAPVTRWEGPVAALRGLVEYFVAYSAWELLTRGAAVVVLLVCAWKRVRDVGLSGTDGESGMIRVVGACFVLYVAFPRVLSDWYYCSTRFLIFGTLLLPALAKIPKRFSLWVAPVGVALSAATVGCDLPALFRSSRELQDVERLAPSVPQGAKILSLDLEYRGWGDTWDEIDKPQPLQHAWGRLVLSRDAVTSQVFATGKPEMGGERFRALAYRPGVLDEAGSLPWSMPDHFYAPARLCGEGRSDACSRVLEERRARLDRVLDRYDLVLLIGPSEIARQVLTKTRLELRRREGVAWLYGVLKG